MGITGLLPLLKDITCDFLDASGAEQTNNLLSLTGLRILTSRSKPAGYLQAW